MEARMTHDKKLNRLFIVISYALVHKLTLYEALRVFDKALDRYGREKT